MRALNKKSISSAQFLFCKIFIAATAPSLSFLEQRRQRLSLCWHGLDLAADTVGCRNDDLAHLFFVYPTNMNETAV